ncbi:MAG TPA: helix-turn-helix domain-containing protein [Methylocella sp.]|jgi:excisionase family DNA binding protein|nr:helix-turn-helix domain-containing protein [Methylocella sp.]
MSNLDVGPGAARVASNPPSLKPVALRRHEAVAYCGLGKSTLYELARDGLISSFKVGGRRLFDRESIDKFLASKRVT